ncbi:MAG: hypothetical protein ABUL58_06735, partial [Steroidobacter sp.]
MARNLKRSVWWTLGALVLGVISWAAFAPITFDSREAVFEIPQGTWARRMAGNKVEILPNHIYLTLGIHDVLLLKNMDDVPQIFGPTLMMPGQSFRLPFEIPSDNQFACTAHASGQMTIVVDPQPIWPWQKIAWRVRTLFRTIKT